MKKKRKIKKKTEYTHSPPPFTPLSYSEIINDVQIIQQISDT